MAPRYDVSLEIAVTDVTFVRPLLDSAVAKYVSNDGLRSSVTCTEVIVVVCSKL